ncbi:MAG: hypothetical protein ACHQLQ_01840 [Candidatus Acidiferrales bacterium]
MSGEQKQDGPDYSAPTFSDRKRLPEFYKVLEIGQEDLARISGVPLETIKAIESGARPFAEPSRTKIWDALFTVMDEKALRDVKAMGPKPYEPFAIMNWYLSLCADVERGARELEILEAQAIVRECEQVN